MNRQNEESNYPVVDKSFSSYCESSKYLIKKDKDLRSLYNQLLDSEKPIGANIAESQVAASNKDFRIKLRITLKEACETEFWLRLFFETEILDEKQFKSLLQDCLELIKLLTSAIKKS